MRPSRVIEIPDGWRPVVIRPMIFGGLVVRSRRCTKSSATQLVGFVGSTFSELAIRASFRSGVMAMFEGGPTTEFGTPFKCSTEGGNFEKSRMEIESFP